MTYVFSIDQAQQWHTGIKQLKKLKPLNITQWDKMLNLLNGAGKDGESKRDQVEQLQLSAIHHRAKKTKRIGPGIIAAWRLVNLAEAEEYEQQRAVLSNAKSGADRVAEHVARRSDIGELPTWDDNETAARIIADPVAACWHYFPLWFTRPPSKLTRAIIKVIWAVMLYGGNQSVGVVRGGGKSTITKALIILAGCIGRIKYAVVFGANAKAAQSIRRDIVRQLETNKMLLADFPAACIPIQLLAGRSQRAMGQTHRGVRTYIRYEADVVQLARIEGANSGGFMIRCQGIESGFLGLIDNGVRPDFILGDDIQGLKAAKSDTEVAGLEDAIRQGFEGLGGKDNPLRIILLATCTRQGDFSDRVLDRELYPEYSGLRFGLIEDWGTAEVLWEEYVKIWRQDQRDGDKRYKNATQFYINNRGAMDDGVKVTDPEFYLVGQELSAIQGAWHARAKMGDLGYFAQMENRPLSSEASLYSLLPSDVSKVVNGLKRFQVPGWGNGVFAFADVGNDKLRWSVVAFGDKSRSAVIDYGFWPPNGRVAPEKCTGTALKTHIWTAMRAVRDHWDNSVYLRSGEAQRIVAAGFDRGYEADTVQDFCKAVSPLSRFPVIAMRGQGFQQWRDVTKRAIRYGWNVQLIQTVEGAAPGEFLNVHTDFWKENAQRAFLSPNYLAAGACSLWGRDPREHGEFADHICSEVLSDKGRGTNGTEFWKWGLKPGRQNHFLDTLVGCYALAGFYGYLRPENNMSTTDQPQEIKQKARKRTTKPTRRKCRVKVQEY